MKELNQTKRLSQFNIKELEDSLQVEQEINASIQIIKNGKEAKEKAIAEILPSLDAVQKNISDTKNLEELKKIVTDLVKIIYITVKGAV